MKRSVEADLVHAPDRGGLLEQLEQLIANTGTGDRHRSARGDSRARKRLRVRVERAAEPGLVAQRAQQPRRIVGEAPVVQDPDRSRGQVPLAAEGINQALGLLERNRHRVDREVATREVREQVGGLDLRERPRMRIALAPRAGDVERERR